MDTPVATASSGNGTPPIAFVVAVWLGMSHEEILRGLAEGSIAPPPGAPPGWTPGWDSESAASGDPTSTAGSTQGGDDGDASQSVTTDQRPEPAGLRTKVETWLRAIDPALATDTFDELWQSASGDDIARGAWWRGYLQRTLAVADDKSAGDLSALDAAIGAAASDPAHRATIVSLEGRSGAAIAELAKTDAGVRYAVDRMDPIALTGNRALAALHDPTGELDRFDPDTGERMLTDALLSDRSKLLAWKLRRDAGGDLAIPGDARWTFVDRAQIGADGKPFTLTLEGAQAGASTVSHQVIFGTASADIMAGGAADDRLYGGSGDDFVRGGAGSDHVEGGRGADTLVGGRGDDELVGGAGDDDLDGGAGSDSVDGGSGDDTLEGGRGNDSLDGGTGDDTYVFESGDGHDVIVDADGRGHIVFDDVQLSGAGVKRGADGVWRDGDGRFELRYTRSATDAGVLSIRTAANGSVDNDEIRIRDWHNGDLGLALGDGSAQALAATDAVDSGNGFGANAATDTSLPFPADSTTVSGDDDTVATTVESSAVQPADDSSEATAIAATVTPSDTGQSAGSPASVPDVPDASEPEASSEGTPAGDGPPDVPGATHPLDSLWSLHDRALEGLVGSLVDTATIASAAKSFAGALSMPDVTLVATDGHVAWADGALGGGEIVAASASSDGALATWSFEAAGAARAGAMVLAPHDPSLASMAALADGVSRPRAP